MAFNGVLQAHSAAYGNAPDLENTGRVNLPDDVLQQIFSRMDHPPEVMLFRIRNERNGVTLYAGVKTFTAPPNACVMPYWMIQYLQVNEGDPIRVSLNPLPKATRAVLQPLDESFIKLEKTNVVLEYNLRQYPCLVQGTTIEIMFNKKLYKLKVLKTEPQSAVEIMRADVVCDFATPVSQFEHHWNDPDSDSSDEEVQPVIAHTINGKTVIEPPKHQWSTYEQRENDRKTKPALSGITKFEAGKVVAPPTPKEKKKGEPKAPNPFAGSGHTLKGGKSNDNLSSVASGTKTPPPPGLKPNPLPSEEKPKPQMFSGTPRTLKDSKPATPQNRPAPTASTSQPAPQPVKQTIFQGTGYTLKGDHVTIPSQAPKPDEAKEDPKEKKKPFSTGHPRSLK